MRNVASTLQCILLILVAACGGGGGGGGPSSAGPGPGGASEGTQVSGDASPPVVAPAATDPFAPIITSANLRIPPGAGGSSFPALAQEAVYLLDLSAVPQVKVFAVEVRPPALSGATFSLIFDPTSYPGDAALAKPKQLQVNLPTVGVAAGNGDGTDIALGGLPSLALSTQLAAGDASAIAYVIPFSAAINPQGYTFQTFGVYADVPAGPTAREGYFSAGVPTASALPGGGTATYTGKVQASFVDATTRDPGEAAATVNITVNFGTRSISITTTNTSAISNNAPESALPQPSAQLDLSGTLTYAAGGNTFSGIVTSGNGLSGNVAGRFYGPGIPATTASMAVGSPPEVGGTFALLAPGVGVLYGAFGAK